MLVTDSSRSGGDLVSAVAAAIDGGVNIVQLREPGLSAREHLQLGRELRRVTAGRALLVVNDRLDVAVLAGADGVHLGERGLPVAEVRRWLPTDLLIGRSVHDVASAEQAAMDGADYMLVGTVFASKSHPGAVPAGLELLIEIAHRVTIPVLGIGGIGPAQAAACRRAGAAGVAVVGAILETVDRRGAAATLSAALEVPIDPGNCER